MSSFASSAEESNKDAKGAKANNKTIGGGSSASSVVKIITPSTASPWGTIGRTFVLSAVALFSKALLGVFNSTTISNHETFVRAATREDRGIATTTKDDDEEEEEEEEKKKKKKKKKRTGLITVANHHSTFDDPGVLAYMTPLKFFLTEMFHKNNRWTLCTAEVATTNKFVESFILSGKGIPIYRGGGIEQPCMKVMAELVAAGRWLQIFPEGKINKEPRGQTPLDQRLKWGLGKILCDIEEMGGAQPMILPFWHSGMDEVKPYEGCKTIFRWGKRVHVTVGEPIDMKRFRGRCGKCKNEEEKGALYAEMMTVVRDKMNEVRKKNLEEREQMGITVSEEERKNE